MYRHLAYFLAALTWDNSWRDDLHRFSFMKIRFCWLNPMRLVFVLRSFLLLSYMAFLCCLEVNRTMIGRGRRSFSCCNGPLMRWVISMSEGVISGLIFYNTDMMIALVFSSPFGASGIPQTSTFTNR